MPGCHAHGFQGTYSWKCDLWFGEARKATGSSRARPPAQTWLFPDPTYSFASFGSASWLSVNS
jgi:hypothetical protein